VNWGKINNVWQLLGGPVLAPVTLSLLLLLWFTQPDIVFYQWLLALHFPLFLFHEFEEYVLPGGFKKFINTETGLAADPPVDDAPANDLYMFVVNVGIFWPLIILGAVLANVAPWVGFIVVMLQILMNIFTHSFAFQTRHRGYNPGFITNTFVIIPYCTLVVGYVIVAHVFTTLDWALGLGIPVAMVLVMAAVTLTRRKRATAHATA
jgi:hypothetical protein